MKELEIILNEIDTCLQTNSAKQEIVDLLQSGIILQ
jgi:hypothetical protein